MKLKIFAAIILLSSVARATESRTVNIAAVGDIMMGTNFPADTLRADEGAGLFKDTTDYFKTADIVFGNLEGTLYDGDVTADGKAVGANRFLFRTPTSYAHWLADAGINVVSLANNHALDFGRDGLASTKQSLERVGIKYSSKKPGEVAVFDVQGLHVALIAVDFYPGARSLSMPAGVLKEIRTLREKYDIVIVSAHAGGEGIGYEHVREGSEFYLGENRGDPVSFAHQAIDAGASLILMHGPHVVRAMEIYSERLIVYSLGNFLTERGIDVSGRQGLAPLLRVKLDEEGRFVGGDITSFKQVRGVGTVYDPNKAALQTIQHLSELDFPTTMPQFDSQSGRIYRRSTDTEP
jgi:poly-gamma-glutamate capsule biosynthesis protein CapA/YwtB (metallophosphatase superfamily)